jgi:hypothetical protein
MGWMAVYREFVKVSETRMTHQCERLLVSQLYSTHLDNDSLN